MSVTFRTEGVSLAESMTFEECLHPALRISSEGRKKELLDNGIAAWAFVDGALAGECYGAPAAYAHDPDISQFGGDPQCMCLFGVEVFEPFRKLGVGKSLVTYWNGIVHAAGYTSVVGHCAHAAMTAIERYLGAEWLGERHKWGGTNYTAQFFRMVP